MKKIMPLSVDQNPIYPLILGLTGSIAMGKTTIANLFKNRAIPVFSSDEVIYQIYDEDYVQEQLKTLFFEEGKDHKIKRQNVSHYIIKYPEKLPVLEGILYPHLAKKREDFLKKQRETKQKLVVLDIPLLFEKKLTHIVDKILVVTASEAIQKQRAFLRKDMSEEKFATIISKQLSNSEKCALADYIINTEQPLSQCEIEVEALIGRLIK